MMEGAVARKIGGSRRAMGRQCGGCTLCCKLLPVQSLGKPATTRCQHQRTGKGCAIYWTRQPLDCQLWNCQWLGNPATAGLARPDRSHYVVDIVEDLVRLERDDGEALEMACLQVWVDPAFPDAHRDPALRAFLQAEGRVAIVRYGVGADAFVLVPPISGGGEWIEQASLLHPDPDFSLIGRLRAALA